MLFKKSSGDHILRREAAGFLTIIFLSWLAEAIHLPHLLFGGEPEFNWPRVLLRTFIILGVWAWVHWSTRKLVQRLHRLEEFLLVCSWCRRVGDKGNWSTLEEYFGEKFDTQTSHGICPQCMEEQRAKGPRAVRVTSASDK
jgi:hypothetical protein